MCPPTYLRHWATGWLAYSKREAGGGLQYPPYLKVILILRKLERTGGGLEGGRTLL